jgi:uroporphyrin-III C-methyltransferase
MNRRGTEEVKEARKMSLGKVYLVGAGPGDPGLMTLKGKALLECADVVIYDALVSPQILAAINPQAERIDAGKRKGRHSLMQDETTQLMIEKAGDNAIVVRLKGGDPFIFGRGGEEMEELVKAGVSVEVVPGVTSGIAAPAYAGIPLTHRSYCICQHILTITVRHSLLIQSLSLKSFVSYLLVYRLFSRDLKELFRSDYTLLESLV